MAGAEYSPGAFLLGVFVTGGRRPLGPQRLITAANYELLDVLPARDTGQEVGTKAGRLARTPRTRRLQVAFSEGGKSGGQGLPNVLGAPWPGEPWVWGRTGWGPGGSGQADNIRVPSPGCSLLRPRRWCRMSSLAQTPQLSGNPGLP